MKCHFFERIVQTPVLCSLVRISSILEIISPAFSLPLAEWVCVFGKNSMSSVNSLCIWRFPFSSYQVCIIYFYFFLVLSEITSTIFIFFSHFLLLFKRTMISLILICVFFFTKKSISVFSRKPIFVIVSFVFFFTFFYSFFRVYFSSFFFIGASMQTRTFSFIFCSCHFQPHFHSH